MNRSKKKRWLTKRNTVLVSGLVFLTLVAQSVKEIVALSTEPQGDKDCGQPTDAAAGPNVAMPEAMHRGSIINDASCLNPTKVYGIISVQEEQHIRKAIISAKTNGLKVSIAGARHSMGGQAFAANAVVLDMTAFKKMSVDKQNRVLTVQSGATWADVQYYLQPKGLAVKAMQSVDILTIGGSVAANGHGADHHIGSMGSTVRSMRVMLADGTIQKVSRTQEPELFKAVIGGYGLMGVILDTELEVVLDEMYNRTREVIDYRDFPRIYKEKIAGNPQYGLVYTNLSTAPSSFMRQLMVYYHGRTEDKAPAPALKEPEHNKASRFFLNFAKTGPFGREVKWFMQKYVQPKFETCSVNRNHALGEQEACLISRNQQMHDPLGYLKNNLKNDTDVLQEYFVPQDKIVELIDGVRVIVRKHKINLLNSGIRVVHQGEKDMMLNYAPQDMFALVMYINQKTTIGDNLKMEQARREIIDLTARLGGTFYLTYQNNYSRQQLERSYPNIDSFFELKRKYDPQGVFTNKFYQKYGSTD